MARRARKTLTALVALGALLSGCAPAAPLVSMERWAAGDSLTWGSVHGVTVGPGWPVYYTEQTGRPIANLAVSALTIPGVWSRVREVISDRGVPERVAILAGTNDLPYRTVEEMGASVEAFTADLEARGIEVLWITLPPFPDYSFLTVWDQKRVEFNQWLLAEFGARAVDCSTPLQLGQWMNPDYALGDQSHLNVVGAGVLAACIAPHLP